MKNRAINPDNRDPVAEQLSVDNFRVAYQTRSGGTTIVPAPESPANSETEKAKPETSNGNA